jgi:hypothetical protein
MVHERPIVVQISTGVCRTLELEMTLRHQPLATALQAYYDNFSHQAVAGTVIRNLWAALR